MVRGPTIGRVGVLDVRPVRGQKSRPGVVVGLAVFCAVSVAIAGFVLYRQYWPAKRDENGVVVRAGRISVRDTRVGDCVTDDPTIVKAGSYMAAS